METDHWKFRGYCALAAEPLTFRNIRDAVTVLVNSKIAPVTKHNRVAVLSLSIVTYSTSRVLSGQIHVWLGNLLHQNEPLFL
jgi:hypothetical protein